jgi:hypothetical protein
MNMRKKVMLVLLLVALMVFSAAPVFAQTMPEPFCGQLSEDDCTLLKESQTAQMGLSSYTSSVDATTTVAGLPGLPADELTFNWTQDATLFLDPDVTSQMMELQSAGPEAIMKNMDDFKTITVDFYKTLGVDATVDFTMPAEIAGILSAQAGMKVPEELNLHVILKDGFAYIATEGLAFLDPSLPDMGEWLGVDLAGAVEMGLDQSMNSSDPAQQQAMMQSLGISSMLNSEQVRSLVEDFVLVNRLDDAQVDDTDVAVFEHGFDFAGFLASPGFWQLIEDNLDTINAMSQTPVTAEELQQARMALTFLGPALLQGLELKATNSIGLEDYYNYAQSVDFNWDLSGLLQMAASTGAIPAGGPTDASVSLLIDATNADFDAAPEIEAPADAIIVPLNGAQAQ